MESTPSPAAAADSPPVRTTPPPPRRPLTPRQERFCQAYVLTPNAARAARRAGYSASNAKAQGWRLLQARRIRARLAEIQAGLAGDCGQDLETLIGKLEVVYRQAIEDRRSYAAARAVELQARLAGVRAGRARAPAAVAAEDDDENRRYTEDELDAMIARAEAEIRRVMGEPEPDDDAWLRVDDTPSAIRSA